MTGKELKGQPYFMGKGHSFMGESQNPDIYQEILQTKLSFGTFCPCTGKIYIKYSKFNGKYYVEIILNHLPVQNQVFNHILSRLECHGKYREMA